MSKAKSTVVYFHTFPDGSGIKTEVNLNGKPVRWHIKETIPKSDDTMLDVQVKYHTVDNVVNTPIGGIPTISTKETKEYEMTFKQYKKFVADFWENGPEYFNMI